MTRPTMREALPVWGRIGLLSFGGPAAQIALMHRMIVDERQWLSERDYLNALSFCMLLPGPEAMQLATYTGWRMNGTVGGLVAGLLFVLPGAIVVLALACIYVLYGNAPILNTLFLGIKAAVLAIILEALLRMAKKGLKSRYRWLLAGLSFAALFFFDLPFPLLIAMAGLYGFLSGPQDHDDQRQGGPPVSWKRTAITVLIWVPVWFVPLFAVGMLTGNELFMELGIFFSKLATVTFGGAYAVLAYMAQDAVQTKSWLTTLEMMDGLGLAETTPGPLILVTEFVGFLAGARADGGIDLVMGTAAAGVALWATFAPCFLWVFAGAPYIEWIASKRRLRGALAAISAAVVGVILNLSIWFALHVLFRQVDRIDLGILILWKPEFSQIDIVAVVLAIIAAVLLFGMKRGVMPTLCICGGLSLIIPYVGF